MILHDGISRDEVLHKKVIHIRENFPRSVQKSAISKNKIQVVDFLKKF